MPRIFLKHLDAGYVSAICEGFAFIGRDKCIRPSDKICIKPNLTFPRFRKGVMTCPDALIALVEYLKNFTPHITICESDSGGYNRFSMDEVYRVTGIGGVASRYGVRLLNLSHVPSRPIRVRTALRSLVVPMPAVVLDETDMFVTMPVPKVHANTVISVAVKNQWGIIQDPKVRLKLHPYFKHVIYAVNKALPNPMAVVDGMYGLNRNGPMRGDAVDLNWMMISDNLFYNDVAAAELMGFHPASIPHLRYAMRKEGIRSADEAAFNTDRKAFQRVRFRLTREWTDYPGFFTFHSRLLAYLGYESALARPLHTLLYQFRQPFY